MFELFDDSDLKVKQREAEVEVVLKLLNEEDAMKKRKNVLPYLFVDPKKEKAKVCRLPVFHTTDLRMIVFVPNNYKYFI